MSTTLDNIKPETLARIERQAHFLGLSADAYLRRLLPAEEQELALSPDISDDEFVKDMAEFADVDSVTSYTGSYSREDIYFDHD